MEPAPQDVAGKLLNDGDPAAALQVLELARSTLTSDGLYLGARASLLCGQRESALDWLDEARAMYRTSGDELSALRTELGRIDVLHDLGRNHESVQVAERLRHDLGLIQIDSLSPDDQQLHRWLFAVSAVNLGSVLSAVGRHSVAADVFAEAKMLCTGILTPLDQAQLQANLGLELLHTGFHAQAAVELTEAKKHFVDAGDQWLRYRCTVYLSQAVAASGRYGTALDLIEEADACIVNIDTMSTPDSLRARLARAQVQVALNLFPEVLDQCGAIAPVLTNLEMTHDLAHCRLLQAMALIGLGRTKAAAEAGANSVELFHQAELPVRSARARITLARCLGPDDGCAQVDTAIEVLEHAGESRRLAEAALTGADLARASVERGRYLDVAEAAGALDTPELSWRLRWHRSEITDDTNDRSALLDASLGDLGTMRNDLATDYLRAPFLVNRRHPLESRLALHLDKNETDRAFLLSSAYRASTMTPSGTVQHSLPTEVDTTTLLYQSIGLRLVCFVKHSSNTVDSPGRLDVIDLGNVLADVDDLMYQLEAEWRHLADPELRRYLPASSEIVDDILQRLHQVVFAEVERKIGPGPVTIVPTGRIASLPFAALRDGEGHVQDRRVISMCPGLPHGTGGAVSPAANTLVVGVPDANAPQIETEVRRIHEIADGRLLLGTVATADATRAAAESADIIHLAGHSAFRAENPWLSSFTFADRQATAIEFAEWDLAGATVILASCSSGRQANLSEDEMLGIPRALLMAGAREVIVNLWAVDDNASVELMSHFHRGLAHTSAAAALHSAQQVTRKNYPNPYFWAAPVHYRNPFESG